MNHWLRIAIVSIVSVLSEAQATQVSIAGDGMIVINGQRTFVLGLYENPGDDAVLDQVADAGFNLVCASCDSASLDRLAARGLYGWVNLGGRIDLGTDGHKDDAPLREAVATCGAHPALLVWEVPDEVLWGCWLAAYHANPNWLDAIVDFKRRAADTAAGLLAGYERMRALDPAHPIWMNHAPCNAHGDLAAFGRAADIVGCDIYPVMHFTDSPWDWSGYFLGFVGQMTRVMQAAAPEKPVWMVLQGFGYCDLGRGPLILETSGSRRPTAAEVRFMVFDAVVRGARGVLFWGTHAVEKDAPLWQGVLDAARELDGLKDVLAAPDTDIEVDAQARALVLPMNDGVHALGKAVNGQVWWLVVNEYPFKLDYVLRGLHALNGVKYRDERAGVEATVRWNALSLELPAYGIHVLRPVQ